MLKINPGPGLVLTTEVLVMGLNPSTFKNQMAKCRSSRNPKRMHNEVCPYK